MIQIALIILNLATPIFSTEPSMGLNPTDLLAVSEAAALLRVGLTFAYASTALGIMISVILRLGYLTPYRHLLTRTIYAASPVSTPEG